MREDAAGNRQRRYKKGVMDCEIPKALLNVSAMQLGARNDAPRAKQVNHPHMCVCWFISLLRILQGKGQTGSALLIAAKKMLKSQPQLVSFMPTQALGHQPCSANNC